MSGDIEKHLQAQVRDACARRRPLTIVGGASKIFYGRRADADADELRTADHAGVIRYDPAELVVTARAGTPLSALEKILAAQNQTLGFEPPHFSRDDADTATIGGAVAAGIAGPRRPYSGAVRDFVLGVKVLTGGGEVMRFGGEVMKNVAGFDIARLQAGALGTLGVLLEVSVRVVPAAAAERTLLLERTAADAVALFNKLAAQPLPLSAAAWHGGVARIRLSASAAGVANAAKVIGGDTDADADSFWKKLRDHHLPFFAGGQRLLRVSLPAATAVAGDADGQLVDWGGAQRWLSGGDINLSALREAVAGDCGHVTVFRHGDGDDVFHPLAPTVHQLHLKLKSAFDPAGVFNPRRLYRDI